MNTSFGFFPYEAMNYKAAQTWLNRKAAQGWGLKHIYLGCIARLQRMERPSHFVDLDIRGGFDGGTDVDYLQLCSDAGWELVQQLRGMLLFRSAPGKSPAPIQTDGELEWERFWKKYRPRIWSTLITIIAIGLVVFMLSLSTRQNLTVMLAVNSGLLYALYLILMILYTVLKWGHSKWYMSRCRRSNRVEDPGPVAIFVDSLYHLRIPVLCLILVGIITDNALGTTVDLDWYSPNETYTATTEACQEWPVLMAVDLNLPDSGYSRHLEGHRTVLMDFLEYRELIAQKESDVPPYILTTERYDCLTETLAKLAIAQRQKETRNGAFLWGELEWESASLTDFDECYTCREGSYLLFRQGKVVALVGCSGVNLATSQNLEVIRERILNGQQ